MVNELHIFDFDGTLFNSPKNTPENLQKFEETTGIPWLINKSQSKELSLKHGRTIKTRSGWWGRPETLEPPLVPDPAPLEWFNQEVVEAFLQSKANPNTLTCIMTGRHVGLRKHVKRICQDGNLFTVEEKFLCLLLGDDGPNPQGEKPSDTLGWKIWMTRQLANSNKDVKKIVFWEDREEHIPHFLGLNNELAEVVVHHIR